MTTPENAQAVKTPHPWIRRLLHFFLGLWLLGASLFFFFRFSFSFYDANKAAINPLINRFFR